MTTGTGDYRPGLNPSENPADNLTPPAPAPGRDRPEHGQASASDADALNLIEGTQ